MIKKILFIFLLATIFTLSTITAFTDNSGYIKGINNWKSFVIDGKHTASYEFKNGMPETPILHTNNKELGDIFFPLRIDSTEEFRNEFTAVLQKTEGVESSEEHFKYRYMVWDCKLDCDTGKANVEAIYYYSDTNKLILKEDIVETNDPKYITGPILYNNKNFINKIINMPTCIVQAKLKKHKVKAIVNILSLEANPYEHENKTIAINAKFQRMISRSSASFYSGYQVDPRFIHAPDQIIVSGIPAKTQFKSSPYPGPETILIVEGRGSISGTNAYGAKIIVPNLQYIDHMIGELPKK